MARRAFLAYAAAMVIAGFAWGWHAPLGWDEEKYYLPAAKFFAERGVALDYPMPMPPFALVLQGFVYRVSESVYLLRVLSTLAAIGAAAVFATMLAGGRFGREPGTDSISSTGSESAGSNASRLGGRTAALLFMFGTFPASLMNAFSLKHHSLVLLGCVGAFALWQRQRVTLAAMVLAVGALTHQIIGAMIAMLVVLSLIERRTRDAAIIACAALPLAALIVLWRGARPPMHEATFTAEPAMSGLQPAQLVVLLFMAGAWIAPAVKVRWIAVVAALPVTALWIHFAGLMRPVSVYERLAGPVSSMITAVTRQQFVIAAIVAGAVAALGLALHFQKHLQFTVWSAMYAVVMLAVPYFFESYYALYIAVGWMLLRKEIAERPPWFPLAATLAGIGYVILKA